MACLAGPHRRVKCSGHAPTPGDTTVLTGLANGTPYTFTVAATNPVGTETTTISAAVRPTAVPGGPSPCISAVSQPVSQSVPERPGALDTGQAPTAAAYGWSISTWWLTAAAMARRSPWSEVITRSRRRIG